MIDSAVTLPPALFSPLAIAPMIDWTYMHFRVLMRILAPSALLYTEMQTTGAIEHNAERSLAFHPMETPLALQLGGAHPEALLRAGLRAQALGFSEINLNLGCPSSRVQAGRFGACLMAEPELIAACIRTLKSELTIPVTAKSRIGINEHDSYAYFSHFARVLLDAGIDKLIVHARKAWLNGLSPKQNRTVPPLHYDYVYRIKQEFPNAAIVLNGNVQTEDEIKNHLRFVDGVMLGRIAYQNPYKIALFHHALYPQTPLPTRSSVLANYLHYVTSVYKKEERLGPYIKPILNLAHSLPDSKTWREKLVAIQQQGTIKSLEACLGLFEKLDVQF